MSMAGHDACNVIDFPRRPMAVRLAPSRAWSPLGWQPTEIGFGRALLAATALVLAGGASLTWLVHLNPIFHG